MTLQEVLGPEITEEIDKNRAEVEFGEDNYFWWAPDQMAALGPQPPSLKPRRIRITQFDRLIINLAHAALHERRISRMAVIYPTTRHSVLVPTVISAAYDTLGAGAKTNCVVGWTPNRDLIAGYQNVFIGHSAPETPLNVVFPLAAATSKGPDQIAPVPPGRPKPRGPAKIILSSKPDFFYENLAPGFKPLALVVDTNHRLIPRRIDEIEAWANKHQVPLTLLLISNPLDAFVRDLWYRKYTILPWTPKEAAVTNAASTAAAPIVLDNPFNRSIKPLENLTRPDFSYEIHSVKDDEVDAILTAAQKTLRDLSQAPTHDQTAREAAASAKALYHKMRTLAVPLELHKKHAGSNPLASSIPRHIEQMRRFADQIRPTHLGATERLIQFADSAQTFCDTVQKHDAGKARAIIAMVRDIKADVLVAEPTYYERDAVAEFLRPHLEGKQVRFARLADLDDEAFCEELWLTAIPRIYQLHFLRSGVAPKVRILSYPSEEDQIPDLIDVAHAASGHTDYIGERVNGLGSLLGKTFARDKVPTALQTQGLRIMKGGAVVVRKRKKPASEIIQELQKALDWTGDMYRDPILHAPPRPKTPGGEEKEVDAVFVDVDNGTGFALHPDDLVTRAVAEEDEPEPVAASLLKKGEQVLVSTSDLRKPVNATLFEKLNEIPGISALVYLARRWSSRLKEYRADKHLPYAQLYQRFQAIKIEGRPTTIRVPLTLRFWAEGFVLGPLNPDDLQRVMLLAEGQDLLADLPQTMSAIRRLRGLRAKIIRHILDHARSGHWDHRIVIDEEYDIYFDDFQSLFQTQKIVEVRRGKIAESKLGERYTWRN